MTVGQLVRDTVETARSGNPDLNHDEVLDELVEALARSSGGPYALASAVFRFLDREERDRRLAFVSYGTVTQDAMMARVARAVVENPNGARRRFAFLLDAAAEGRAGYVSPRLAVKYFGAEALSAIADAPNLRAAADADRARAILEPKDDDPC